MSYNLIAVPTFKKKLKRLAKKYPSLKSELATLFEALVLDPEQGISLGNNCYKIRIAVASKNKGKSGGARLVTNFVIAEATIYLLSIYDKSEKDNITDKEFKELLSSVK